MAATRTFADGREAKEFMVGCIVAEAEREGVPLSDVERKMLYFTETAWAPPDILEVNEAFEREYDTEEYEQKIARLIRGFCAHACTETPEAFDAWNQACCVLAQEDHYLLVLVGEADHPTAATRKASGWVDRLKLLGTALVVVCVIFAAIALYDWFRS